MNQTHRPSKVNSQFMTRKESTGKKNVNLLRMRSAVISSNHNAAKLCPPAFLGCRECGITTDITCPTGSTSFEVGLFCLFYFVGCTNLLIAVYDFNVSSFAFDCLSIKHFFIICYGQAFACLFWGTTLLLFVIIFLLSTPHFKCGI